MFEAQKFFDPNVNGRNVLIGLQEIGLRLLVGVRDHVKVTTEGHYDLGKFFPYGGLVHHGEERARDKDEPGSPACFGRRTPRPRPREPKVSTTSVEQAV